jgi:competence protein ComEA
VDLSTGEQQKRARLRLTMGACVVLVVVAAIIAVLVAALAPKGVERDAVAPSTVQSATPEAGGAAAFVHIVGQVRSPGLYELRAGDRVVDAVAAAGGFTAAADQSQLNLARVIADGEQIVVARKGAAPANPGASGSGKVDINTADETALEMLDGVGPALAKRILDYRTAHGRFSSPNDLLNVTGIGDKKLAAFKDDITT